jgi:hypothetical protein
VSTTARRLRPFRAFVALTALGLRCYVFAACPPGAEAASHVDADREVHAHGHAAGPAGSLDHRHDTGMPASGGDDHGSAPAQCCESSGDCVFIVTPKTSGDHGVFRIEPVWAVARSLEVPGFETARTTLHALTHGPPSYLRFSSLRI